ncbi:MAG: hypothetical protein ACK5NN_04110 [Sphingomonadaceae bacterium]
MNSGKNRLRRAQLLVRKYRVERQCSAVALGEAQTRLQRLQAADLRAGQLVCAYDTMCGENTAHDLAARAVLRVMLQEARRSAAGELEEAHQKVRTGLVALGRADQRVKQAQEKSDHIASAVSDEAEAEEWSRSARPMSGRQYWHGN